MKSKSHLYLIIYVLKIINHKKAKSIEEYVMSRYMAITHSMIGGLKLPAHYHDVLMD